MSSPLIITTSPQGVDTPLVQGLSSPTGLVSVLVACCGGLEYTRLCVASLLQHSRPPLELLFLDSGSLDGTNEYLAGVQAAAPVRVEVIKVAAGTREGTPPDEVLQVAGEWIVLLNNDTLVTDGWLGRLAGVAVLDPALGMVAPRSNYAPPPLLVEAVPYRIGPDRAGALADWPRAAEVVLQLDLVDRFAREWARQHRGEWAEAEQLGGGCALLKRDVFQTLGLFPTRSALGAFDLEGLSQRVRQAGYRLAVCGELFVHHFGVRSPVRNR
jgi:GT2 family glycosyltransferase